ncbi:hypothetical protein GCM10010517_03950 [Streptosporangium fragile]|uniref:Uncharacterized protein n=1 Tax=Streptosporangium fragile TaxID=46186 RepID=A0ABN3VPH9_9ACTN
MTAAHESEPCGAPLWAPRYWGADEFMNHGFGDIGRRFELEDGCVVLTIDPGTLA